VTRPGFRATAEPPSGSGPTRLLLGGVGLGIIGMLVFAYGVAGAYSQMDRSGGPPAIFLVLQWVGFVAVPSGVVMVVSSVVWWIWRIVRR
jgi:hypothetical protein